MREKLSFVIPGCAKHEPESIKRQFPLLSGFRARRAARVAPE
ncbi:hypothetical protein [Bradyrhizobium sp. SRS-191]|nr:hypothetical protein [Bradyrhizobium sp. SRS-191]